MTVQYSIQKMVSDGTLSTIALGIQYLQRNDIYMRIAGEDTPQVGAHSGYTWSFINNTTLKILPVVPNGVEVVMYRRTDVDAMYNIYSQNAQFDEATIDENNQQLLYIAQEYLEQGLPGAGVDTLEYVRDDGSFTYYRMRRTDGSYSKEFTVPSASSSTKVLTRESLRRSYAEAGYNLVDGSFEAGGTLVNANDALLHEASGKGFSGPAGTVAAGTDPTSGGFVGRSGVLLRSKVGSIVANATHVADVPGINLSGSVNNRTAIFAVSGSIFIPAGMSVRCNLLPDDDVRKFVGQGEVLSTDPWGFTHTLDVAAINSGLPLTPKQVISRANVALALAGATRIGVLGDSITDGAFGGDFTTPNPTDGSGNLSSTNYTHGATEATGSKAWFTLLVNNLIGLSGHNAEHPRAVFHAYNAASSGKGIADGWAYRNFDYGFFQNQAYGNAAPDVLFVSMGTNDVAGNRSPALQDAYLDKCDALIAKAAGYGCKAVCFVAITHWRSLAPAFYEATFKHITSRHPTVDFINAAAYLEDYSNAAKGNWTGAWLKTPGAGGGFDPVHPSVDGHKILAGAVASSLMPDRVERVSEGSRFMAAQSGRSQAWTTLSDEIIPFGTPVSSAWLAPETGWPIYQASNTATGANITIRHFVWCDAPLDLTIIEPKAADYPAGSSKITSVSVMRHGYDEPGVTTQPLTSSGVTVGSYCATLVKSLVMGLNIIDVTYVNVLNVYAPIFEFSKPGYVSKSLGAFMQNMTPNTARHYSHTTAKETVFDRGNLLPGAGSDWLVTMPIAEAEAGIAVMCWHDIYTGTAYAVLKISATQVQVCSVTNNTTMTVLTTITGDFSSGYVVQYVKLGTSGLIQIRDSNLAAYTHTLPAVSGGSIGICNTTAGAARMKMQDVRIEMPKVDGTLII